MTGLRIKDLLRKNGFSVSEVAQKIGTTNQNLFNLLSKDDIKTGLVERIGEATGISLAELYGIHPTAVNTGTNNGNIAGRDINTSEQISNLHGIIGSQQQTIAELSATIAKLVK